ncbi:MAG TPA: protein-glutamate O-methyltransferase CheR [Planctomycetia bacterium]|nr:protein-glutamate O-methyltransferase CheR [Planctomycetia bacterium]
MSTKEPNPPVPSVGMFLLLRDLISDRLGVWYEEDKRELLASKLSDRVVALGLRSYLEYFYLLKYGPAAEEEWARATDALSVPETYFWREIDQVAAFVDVLLPRHAEADLGKVRIWSAACASGEEPLTLAMALAEKGWFERAEIEIWASDASPLAVEKAERGVYRDRAFRALPQGLKDKYFSPVEGGWRVDPSLKARIRYRRANLLEPRDTVFFELSRYIFCRNVFIYFASATVAQIVARFAERMPSPGYLFVGVSESLLRSNKDFELQQVGPAFVYARK